VSLALSAAILLLLVLPGFLAVQGFLGKIGKRSSDPAGQSGLTWDWIIALPIAAALHALWCTTVVRLCSRQVNLAAVLALLGGITPDKGPWEQVKDSVVHDGGWIFGYFTSISVAAGVLGIMARRIIRARGLDVLLRTFRFANSWHYLFTGEQRLIEDLQELRAKSHSFRVRYRFAQRWTPPLVVVTVSVTVGPEAYIYAGFLKEWGYYNKGEPSWIRLGSARRRKITEDRKDDDNPEQDSWERFYQIVGFAVVLWCKDITTLNVLYRWPSAK
jgi:hypothetical protein